MENTRVPTVKESTAVKKQCEGHVDGFFDLQDIIGHEVLLTDKLSIKDTTWLLSVAYETLFIAIHHNLASGKSLITMLLPMYWNSFAIFVWNGALNNFSSLYTPQTWLFKTFGFFWSLKYDSKEGDLKMQKTLRSKLWRFQNCFWKTSSAVGHCWEKCVISVGAYLDGD